jgi:hypothetical protein
VLCIERENLQFNVSFLLSNLIGEKRHDKSEAAGSLNGVSLGSAAKALLKSKTLKTPQINLSSSKTSFTIALQRKISVRAGVVWGGVWKGKKAKGTPIEAPLSDRVIWSEGF